MGCHRCGNRAQPGSRFCGSCGTPLGNARAGRRTTVPVVFAGRWPAPGGDGGAAQSAAGPIAHPGGQVQS